MRAAIFHEHGGPEVVRIEDVERPEPGPGEVRIQVRAAALNHLDLWVRRGMPIETTMPHIGGSDVAGVVEALGAGVEQVELGTRVVVNPSLWCGRCRYCVRGEESLCESYRILGEHTNGGFADHVVVRAESVYPLPQDYSFEDAAALPISYQTAWRALVTQAALRPGEDVLVVGASGGTASAAVQIARMAGARVFAVTSTPHVDTVRALGADVVYDRLEQEWSKQLYADTGKTGVDVVVENVGAATWKDSVRSLAKGGRLVTYGATSGHRAETDLRLLFWKQLRLIGTTMASRSEFEQMLRAAFQRRFRPVIDTVLPLDEAPIAHARLEAGEQMGKIVLKP